MLQLKLRPPSASPPAARSTAGRLQVVPGRIVLEDVSLQVEAGHRLHRRPVRLREDHPAADDRRAPEVDHGQVRIGGARVAAKPARRGGVPAFGLFPWKTVQRNVALPLQLARTDRADAERRVSEAIATVGLTGHEHKYPAQLSGGMKQRAGLARALATAPDVLLMDEPFAAVDAQVREVLQEDLLALRDRLRQTIVFITHSIDEAITLGDRIIVMGTRPGHIVRDVLVPSSSPHHRPGPAAPGLHRPPGGDLAAVAAVRC